MTDHERAPAKFRCAIWTAVSSIQQTGEDKLSLQDQQDACRDLITRRGWKETSGPYVVDGISRTRFVNLRDAEEAIPALREMLDDAQAGKFDLLTLYDFNRFRDLLPSVSKTLSHYNVQLFSVSQPVEPVPSVSFTPGANGPSSMIQSMSQVISAAQSFDLRDKFRTKMPRRITDRGLPFRIPWGYQKPPGQASNRSAVPIQNPEEAKWLLVMKDMLLNEKKTLREICAHLDSNGVAPPSGSRWWPQTVRNMLTNAFYVGVVEFGKSRVKFDPRANRVSRVYPIPDAQIIKGQGKHIALWDADTHRQILAELDRRGGHYTNRKTNQLSTLLRCPECGATLWLRYSGSRTREDGDRRVWRCAVANAEHGSWPYHDVLEWVSKELVRRLQDERVTVPAQPTNSQAMERITELAELRASRARIEAAYEVGGYPLATFLSKVEAVDKRIATLDNVEAAQTEAEDVRAQWDEMAGSMRAMLAELPVWLREEDALTVNRALRVLIDKIVIEAEERVRIYFRA